MEQRRRYERVRFLASALVISPSTKARFQAYVTSLGRGGLGLFSEGFLEVGQAVELELTWTNPGGQVCKDRLGGVVVASQIGIDGNTLGVQFTETLGQKNRALLDYMQKAQQVES
jgi:hypothetical protein